MVRVPWSLGAWSVERWSVFLARIVHVGESAERRLRERPVGNHVMKVA